MYMIKVGSVGVILAWMGPFIFERYLDFDVCIDFDTWIYIYLLNTERRGSLDRLMLDVWTKAQAVFYFTWLLNRIKPYVSTYLALESW